MSEPSDHLLTVSDIAKQLAVPESWVYSKAEDGSLPSLKIGRYRRFRASEIARWLEAKHQGPRTPAAIDGHR